MGYRGQPIEHHVVMPAVTHAPGPIDSPTRLRGVEDEALADEPVSEIQRAVRVVLVDDHTLFRKGLASLLNRDRRINVVGQAADAKEAIRVAESLRPDVVVLDLRLPDMSGLEAGRVILLRVPGVKVIILTALESDQHVASTLAYGASGYLLKDSEPEALITAIEAAMNGSFVATASVARQAFNTSTSKSTRRAAYDGMSDRELDVLKLTASGLGAKHVAQRLKLSEKTIRNHIANIYEKLGIHDRSQALLYAVRKGLVDPEGLHAAASQDADGAH